MSQDLLGHEAHTGRPAIKVFRPAGGGSTFSIFDQTVGETTDLQNNNVDVNDTTNSTLSNQQQSTQNQQSTALPTTTTTTQKPPATSVINDGTSTRPCTRVHQQPGGNSTFSLFG